MEIIGKIIKAFPEVGGQSKAGNMWRKREYVLETIETYPKKVHFDFFGERVDQFPLNEGDTIKLYFDIESREYNERWYTSIRGWKAEPATVNIVGQPSQVAASAAPAPVADPNIPISTPDPMSYGAPSTDDLPF